MKDAQISIVVEGKEYVPIVQTVLQDNLRDTKVDWDYSSQSASGLAQTILLKEHRPVLLVLNSVSSDPARGEERRAIVHQLLYIYADREFWEVAIAEPNLEAWHVADEREATELIANTPDLRRAVAFLERVKNGAVAAA
jgi:hypothetical protein